jgi:hypothetical protein
MQERFMQQGGVHSAAFASHSSNHLSIHTSQFTATTPAAAPATAPTRQACYLQIVPLMIRFE